MVPLEARRVSGIHGKSAVGPWCGAAGLSKGVSKMRERPFFEARLAGVTWAFNNFRSTPLGFRSSMGQMYTVSRSLTSVGCTTVYVSFVRYGTVSSGLVIF